MTLIEIMIVLALMGLLLGVVTMFYGRSAESALREETVRVLASLRSAYNAAAATGTHHRVVFDLDEQSYRIESCEGEQRLTVTDEEDTGAAERLAELMEKPLPADYHGELIAAESPEAETAAAAALAGVRVGASRCTLSAGMTGSMKGDGNQRTVDRRAGVHIGEIHVQHLEDAATKGIVTVNFFPLGYAEKAVIRLGNDDGNDYQLLVHGLTGRVEFRAEPTDAERYMRRDDLGERIEDER